MISYSFNQKKQLKKHKKLGYSVNYVIKRHLSIKDEMKIAI